MQQLNNIIIVPYSVHTAIKMTWCDASEDTNFCLEKIPDSANFNWYVTMLTLSGINNNVGTYSTCKYLCVRRNVGTVPVVITQRGFIVILYYGQTRSDILNDCFLKKIYGEWMLQKWKFFFWESNFSRIDEELFFSCAHPFQKSLPLMGRSLEESLQLCCGRSISLADHNVLKTKFLQLLPRSRWGWYCGMW